MTIPTWLYIYLGVITSGVMVALWLTREHHHDDEEHQ